MTKLSPAPTHPIAISKLLSVAALLSLLMPTVGGCSGTNANPLIGSWKFSGTNNKFGAAGCSSEFVFTDKIATITSPPSSVIPAGSVRSMAVTYVTASPTLVAVMTDAGIHVNYSFVDKNHMYTEDPWGRCNYERTS
jgi:hypothetical protein